MTPPRAPTVLLAGHVTLDRLDGNLVPGGSVTYAARTWAGLGARVRVVTAAAPDFPAGALGGAEAVIAPAPRTTTFVNAYPPGGARAQRVEAAAPALSPALVPAGWRGVDVLHLAPVLGELDVAAWLRAVPARLVGLGVQGCVRAVAPDGTVRPRRWSPAPGELEGVHVAFAGEDDLEGQDGLVGRLRAAVPVVVLTHGVRGSEVLRAGEAPVRAGVYPTREVDPTGAGDVFAAAFLLALAGGAGPADAARLGAAAASVAVEAPGTGALGRVTEARVRALDVPILA